ncbi:MAG: hypothetical protein ACOYLQ_15365 [Hyphomicrobiaceae bacterium]
MTLYLDTEFNGHGGELISLALASDKGPHTFYGVLPLPERIHPWVAEHVIPILDREPEPVGVFRMRLQHFLERYGDEGVIADWPDDFAHLMRVMSGPDYTESWCVPLDMRLLNSGDVQPDRPHNALSDAIALARWHVANR